MDDKDAGRICNEEGIGGIPVLFDFEAAAPLARRIFGEVPQRNSPRWRVVSHLMGFRPSVKGLHWETALRAHYFSETAPSLRENYSGFGSSSEFRQLARAIKNVELGRRFAEAFGGEKYSGAKPPAFDRIIGLDGQFFLHLEANRRLDLGADARGLNGCPEALWQLVLFKKAGRGKRCVGRIGINFHSEPQLVGHRTVVSIANVQWAESSGGLREEFEGLFGLPFNLYLLRHLQTVAPRVWAFHKFRMTARADRHPALYSSTCREARSKLGMRDLDRYYHGGEALRRLRAKKPLRKKR